MPGPLATTARPVRQGERCKECLGCCPGEKLVRIIFGSRGLSLAAVPASALPTRPHGPASRKIGAGTRENAHLAQSGRVGHAQAFLARQPLWLNASPAASLAACTARDAACLAHCFGSVTQSYDVAGPQRRRRPLSASVGSADWTAARVLSLWTFQQRCSRLSGLQRNDFACLTSSLSFSAATRVDRPLCH